MNWAKVVEEMYPGDEPEPLHEIQPIVEAVAAAWERWGVKDAEWGDLRGLEERIELDISAFGARKQVVVIDQWRVRDLINPAHYPHCRAGPRHCKIIDWKLRTKEINDRWLSGLERSDQGLWYAHALLAAGLIPPSSAVTVEFRGVQADGGRVLRSVMQVLTTPDIHDFDHQRQWWERRFREDHEDGYQRPWGRDRGGCLKYGPMYPCAFMAYCFEGKKIDVPADFPIVANASFSITEEYKRCPERARLLTIQKNLGILSVEDDGESARMGKAFHAGIAECYKQAEQGSKS